jgi:DNA-binding transcriptional LysR family regulator
MFECVLRESHAPHFRALTAGMNDRLLALKLFVRLARTGSFSQAGKDLKLSQPSASRLIAAFEREVGVKLFVRSTRAVALTESGADYLARIEPALAEIEEAAQALRGKGALRGNLRIGVPASAAIREVIPRLPGFLAKHPELRIDLAVDDGRQDLIREGIDVAIRFGKLEDSSATAVRIGTNPLLVAASPAYLKRAGRPGTPNDLPKHSMMIGLPGTNSACSFEKDGRVVSVKADAPLSANIREAAVAGAVAGIGVVACSLWGCRAELRSGALVQILKDWDMGTAEVHAVYPAGRGVKTAARSFVDYFQKDLKARE